MSDLEARVAAAELAVLALAEREALELGDSDGHPFRGNQYSKGGGNEGYERVKTRYGGGEAVARLGDRHGNIGRIEGLLPIAPSERRRVLNAQRTVREAHAKTAAGHFLMGHEVARRDNAQRILDEHNKREEAAGRGQTSRLVANNPSRTADPGRHKDTVDYLTRKALSGPLSPSDGRKLEAAQNALRASAQEFGDTPGHDFHGNQFTPGGGGSGKVDLNHPSVKEAERLYGSNPWAMASSLQKLYPGVEGAHISKAMDARDAAQDPNQQAWREHAKAIGNEDPNDELYPKDVPEALWPVTDPDFRDNLKTLGEKYSSIPQDFQDVVKSWVDKGFSQQQMADRAAEMVQDL